MIISFVISGGYGDGGYDAAYDDEYPPQRPYPHPGIHGLQYGGDGRQYAAGWQLYMLFYFLISVVFDIIFNFFLSI